MDTHRNHHESLLSGLSAIPASPRKTVWLLLALLSICYVIEIYPSAGRELWFDELFTYYIAKAPTVGGVIDTARKVDLNPPLYDLITRASMVVFGDSAAAVRLPSILAFYAASVLLLLYTRRKTGNAYALFAIAGLWYTGNLSYATEARAYAWVLFCFSLLLVCWDAATRSEPRAFALWGMALANACMLAAHVYALLALVPFLGAEAVRFRQRRKPDYAVWAALLLPLAVLVLYIPLLRAFSTIQFPPYQQGSLRKAAAFFYFTLMGGHYGLLAALALVVFVPPGNRPGKPPGKISRPEWALFGLMLLNPLWLNLMLMRRHGPFFPRYGITTAAVMFVVLSIVLAFRLRFNPRGAYWGAAVMLLLATAMNWITPYLQDRNKPDWAGSIDRIAPELPLVAASGLVFLAMDHYESDALVSRLYYLKDRPSAIKYVHATLFEDYAPDKLRKYFPIRGHDAGYNDFVQRNHNFLVLGDWNYPEDWLLRKLHDDGANIALIGDFRTPYKDKTLYRVTMP